MQQLTITFKSTRYIELNGNPISKHIIRGDRIELLRDLNTFARNVKVNDLRVDNQLQEGLSKLYSVIDSGTNRGIISNKHIDIIFEIKEI